eukprot:2879563-Heterocapsa_arctica.AAC.1
MSGWAVGVLAFGDPKSKIMCGPKGRAVEVERSNGGRGYIFHLFWKLVSANQGPLASSLESGISYFSHRTGRGLSTARSPFSRRQKASPAPPARRKGKKGWTRTSPSRSSSK